MSTGELITIEGIDGAGKTTVIQGTEDCKGLKTRLEDAIFTTEPNDDTWIGEVVRKAINRNEPSLPPTSIFFLFLAEHANHVEDVIIPNIQNGNMVICDRYIDSRYAYQSYELKDKVEGNTLDWIRQVQEQKWTKIPDKTILLDLTVNEAINRLDGDEIFEDREKLENFRQTYLELSEIQSDRYYVVDASQKPEEVISDCYNIIMN